jgi:hypothetical protein
MFIIDNVLVSDELIEEQFVCDLNACKGACCWEGDYGAPLEDKELPILNDIYESVKPFLSEAGIKVIEKQGKYVYYDDAEEFGTPLIKGGPCAYMTYDALGIAQCGIEQAHRAGATDFQKPISCHLYPVRTRKEEAGFEVLNYERWDICSAACTLGAKTKTPVYQFVKPALIRKYGEDFFDVLEKVISGEAEEE